MESIKAVEVVNTKHNEESIPKTSKQYMGIWRGVGDGMWSSTSMTNTTENAARSLCFLKSSPGYEVETKIISFDLPI